MGTRSAPRAKAKAKRLQRFIQQRNRKVPGGGNEFGVESATLNAANQPGSSPKRAAEEWADSIEDLTPIKQVAAAALILGQNVSKTASALGVDRRTIQRWRKLDPEFQLAMVETKQEVIVSSRQYALALAESAVGVVEKKLNDEQNARVALALLRTIGVVSPEALTGPPNYEVADEGSDQREKQASLKVQENDEIRAQSATSTESANSKPQGDDAEEVYELTDLPDRQQVAVKAFFFGKTLPEVARLAQTPESTVRGWLCQDERFFTILTVLQFERIQHLKFRIFALIDRALLIVKTAIESKDGRIAMALLRGLGLMQ